MDAVETVRALAALVGQLKEGKRLTCSLVLRAICMGNTRFFEHAVAALAGVPVGNAIQACNSWPSAALRFVYSPMARILAD